MRKPVFLLLMVSLFLMGIAANVHALPVGLDFNGEEGHAGTWSADYKGYYSETELWTGYYIGTIDGVANKEPMKTAAERYLGYAFDGDHAKVNDTSGTSGYLTTTDNGDGLSGEWFLASPFELGFYAVKGGGGNNFALYYVNPYKSSGKWSTIHVRVGENDNQSQISHLGSLAAPTAVPEPATTLLLGVGLVFLAGLRRKTLIKR